MYTITLVNDEFSDTNQEEHDSAIAARRNALKGVLNIGAEQLVDGKPFFGAEVIVRDGSKSERFLVTMGTSSLL